MLIASALITNLSEQECTDQTQSTSNEAVLIYIFIMRKSVLTIAGFDSDGEFSSDHIAHQEATLVLLLNLPSEVINNHILNQSISHLINK